MTFRVLPALFLLAASIPPLAARESEDAAPDSEKVLLAHYMPWYASRPVSGAWGWHWTMDRFDPDKALENGSREAASHDRPLIGFYDSGDPHVLECQVLQMKLAGIDGVIIDWYGTRDYFDYAMVHRNTEALVPFLEKAGLSFAICYEDQAVGKMVEGGSLGKGEAVPHAIEVLRWVERNWFSRDSYLHLENRPVLLCFGPQYFSPVEWKTVTSAFETDPWIHALPHLANGYGADGPFGWPPVHGGRTLSPAQWRENLEQLYLRARDGEAVVGVAFPGYHDIYEEAGLHDSYGHIAHRDGKTFAETLDLALAGKARLVQVATWNDYGEGTVIEPTENHGYCYLEEIQRRTKPGFDAAALRLPLRLFELRKGSGEPAELDRIARLLHAGETGLADSALAKMESP